MKQWRFFIVALAPLLLAVIVAFLLQRALLPNFLYTVTVQYDLSGLVLRLGFGIMLLALCTAAIRWWSNRRLARTVQHEQVRHSATRRDFLRRLDHELKNPLTIIHLGVLNLRQDSDTSATQRASLNRIAQQTERLQKLIVDLRWLTELDEGSIEQTSVDLNDVLEEAIMLAQDGTKYESRQVTLNVQETPWPLSPVLGDRELLVVAFRNLLENSFKYTADGDRIELRALENGHQAMIEVADSGHGIADAEHDLIFENLYRGQDARNIPGRGLGLPLVQQIITLHGGRISVRSRPKTGTVFTVWLPLVQ
ncbi:MAG: HAMP domain-containing sensor histidine kinase [Caldilineaceae bacterium]